jgi:hypothetical protein
VKKRTEKQTLNDGVSELQLAFDTLAECYADKPIYGGLRESSASEHQWKRVGDALIARLRNPADADDMEAGKIIHQLIVQNGCSPFDMAVFLFNCSRGVGSSTLDLLDAAGFSKRRIAQLHSDCVRLADEIYKFNSSLPGPITYLDVVWVDTPLNREARSMYEWLPFGLELYAEQIKEWPPKPPEGRTHMNASRQFGKNYMVTYFYLYLKHNRCSFRTLSVLLRTMRVAWFQAFPQAAEELKSISNLRMKLVAQPGSKNLRAKLKNKGEQARRKFPFLLYARQLRGSSQQAETEPLGEAALEAALWEFRRLNKQQFPLMEQHIATYFSSPKYNKLRKAGKTFLEVLGTF